MSQSRINNKRHRSTTLVTPRAVKKFLCSKMFQNTLAQCAYMLRIIYGDKNAQLFRYFSLKKANQPYSKQ